MQSMIKLRIVHVRLPGNERQRFAVADQNRQLIVAQRGRVRRHLGRIAEKQSIEFRRRQRKYIRQVELIRAAGFDADRTNEKQFLESLRRLGRHFRRDPAPQRTTDQIDARKAELVQEFQVDMGDIVCAVEPIRQSRFSKAGMRRADESTLLCEQ